MRRDILSFPAAAGPALDRAVAALPALRALGDALRLAARFRDAVRAADRRRGEPPLFFFRPEFQAELLAEPITADSSAALTARRIPAAAAAWDALPGLLAAVEGPLAAVEVRHAARAVPGLAAAAVALIPDHPGAAALAARLAIPDDEVFLVLHPAAGLGWRVRVQGAADVGQFHVLFADAVTGDPGAGKLPGARPPADVVDAYRAGVQDIDGPAPVAAARFQLFLPQAVLGDGTLPTGWAGADHWLWNHHPLAAVPTVDGDRVVLLGDPALPAEWDAEPRFPAIPAAVEVVEAVPTAAVDAWLRAWAGAAPVRRAVPQWVRAA